LIASQIRQRGQATKLQTDCILLLNFSI